MSVDDVSRSPLFNRNISFDQYVRENHAIILEAKALGLTKEDQGPSPSNESALKVSPLKLQKSCEGAIITYDEDNKYCSPGGIYIQDTRSLWSRSAYNHNEDSSSDTNSDE